MKLKLDENGNVVLTDGKPTYVGDDGRDFVFDAPQMYGKITDLTKENAKHREAKEAAEAKVKAFEGIEDAEAARKALETVKNLDEGQLVTAGKVEEIKAAAKKAAEDQVAAAVRASADREKTLAADIAKLQGQLHSELIGGNFNRSKFASEKLAIPADLVQARFGGAYKVEDGKVVAYDGAGNKLFSRSRPGEVADFDEALEILVDQYPHKEHILKGSGASGGGASGAGGASGVGAKRGNFGGSKEDRLAAIKSQFPDLA